MKRRLAFLLALSLSFASFPVAGVSAAELPAEVVESVVEDETAAQGETAAAAEEEAAAAVEATTEESAEAIDTTGNDTAEETIAVEEELQEEELQEEEQTVTVEAADEAVPEENAEDAATASTAEVVDTETASEVEPAAAKTEEVTVLEDGKVSQEATNGFKKENGNWYYYKNGVKQKGKWVTVNGHKYYLKSNGVMATGLYTISGTGTFYFMDSSYAKYDSKLEGSMMTGWKTVNGIVRYFLDEKYAPGGTTGKMLTGWRTIGGYRFFLDDGRVKSNNGRQVTGWQTIDGKVYYFGDSQYPGLPTGAQATGFRTIGGVKYYFADYRYKSLPTGARATGWRTIGGKKYYFVDSQYPYSKETGKMLTGIKTINGKPYYFNAYGVRQTGWVKTTNGLMAYYQSNGTAGPEGWKANGDDWYYLTKNGQARTGWMTLNSTSVFYLDKAEAGKMTVGAKMISGKVYFFEADGRRTRTEGWKTSGKYNYYTYTNGTCAVNTTINGIKVDKYGRTEMTVMDRKAQDYSSDTNYLILVDKTTFKVCIYKGKKGAWARIKGEWYCTHGGSLTPSGEKYIRSHVTKRSATYGWAEFDYSSAAYAVELSSGNFFHSVLYEKLYEGSNYGSKYGGLNPYDREIMDPNLKKDYSHSCIRLETQNAQWIWDNIPIGTKVVIYNS